MTAGLGPGQSKVRTPPGRHREATATMASVQKDFKKVVREAERQGWRTKKIKMGLQLLAPDGVNIVTVHGTPSDHHALDNMIGDMRPYGFKWKGR
jgi:hypothetical protein